MMKETIMKVSRENVAHSLADVYSLSYDKIIKIPAKDNLEYLEKVKEKFLEDENMDHLIIGVYGDINFDSVPIERQKKIIGQIFKLNDEKVDKIADGCDYGHQMMSKCLEEQGSVKMSFGDILDTLISPDLKDRIIRPL